MASPSAPVNRSVLINDQPIEDLMPTWKLTLQKIAELAIQLITSMVLVVIFHALLPISFRAVVLPFIAFGVVFACSFMFASKPISSQVAPAPRDFPAPYVLRKSPTRAQLNVSVPVIQAEAPCGLLNEGNNCWLNSLTQVLRLDRSIMAWIQGLPSPIREFPLCATGLPREVLFSADELLQYELQNVPFTPPLPEVLFPANFSLLTDEAQRSVRQDVDKKILEWIAQIPEFAYLSVLEIENIFSAKPIDELITDQIFERCPAVERVGRKRNAIELIEKLRLYDSKKQTEIIHSWLFQPLPENFAAFSETQRLEYRQISNVRIIRWLSFIEVRKLILPNADLLFSDRPVADCLDLALIAQLPAAEKALGLENATHLITKLRQIALQEQMDQSSKCALVDVFTSDRDERINKRLLEQLKAYRLVLDFVRFLSLNAIEDIQLESFIFNDPPIVRPQWFEGLPESDRENAQNEMNQMVETIRKEPVIFNYFAQHVRFFQNFRALSPLEKETALHYLAFFHTLDQRSETIEFFRQQVLFFDQYESAKNKRESIVALDADSQELRRVFHKLRPNLSEIGTQEDAAVALEVIGNLLPPELKMRERITRDFDTSGLPALLAGVSASRQSSPLVCPPIIHLEIEGDRSNLTSLWHNFRDERVPLKIIGKMG